jgi:hypothetical protein
MFALALVTSVGNRVALPRRAPARPSAIVLGLPPGGPSDRSCRCPDRWFATPDQAGIGGPLAVIVPATVLRYRLTAATCTPHLRRR